jgi:hypothetical protein
MQKRNFICLAGCVWLSFFCQPAFGQGSLTPPGAPAATMKSLDQIEPRTPISSAPYVINVPGSYYLTTNLAVSGGSNGITISASHVTLNLSGFTISSTSATPAGTAIELSSSRGNTNVTILNGHIFSGVTNSGGVFSGKGFYNGIEVDSACRNIRVSGISVIGCANDGINIGNGNTIAEFCTVDSAGTYGVAAGSVLHCDAGLCGVTAILAYSIATECTGTSSGTAGAGVSAATAVNCRGINISSGYGINVTDIATGCYGQSTSGSGITAYIANGCRVGGGTSNISFKYNMP